jgi:hypothetical protein
MLDVCTAVLEQHHDIRLRFAALDERLARDDPDRSDLAAAWLSLRRLLEAHFEAEEFLVFPVAFGAAPDREAGPRHAAVDHSRIREAIAAVERHPVGTVGWRLAVQQVRFANSTHMSGEERGLLADLRVSVPLGLRVSCGAKWTAYMTTRLGTAARADDPT